MQAVSRSSSLRPHSHSRKILFIHSLHFNSRCWEMWLAYYRSRGYVCHAPAWPYHVRDPSLGKLCHPNPQPLTFAEIVEMYIFIIQEEIREPPIIIGHGTGSMIAQILASFGLAIHCVCLAAGSTNTLQNYQRQWSLFLYSAIRRSCVKVPSFRNFHRYYANTLTNQRAKTLYEKHLIPEHIKTIRNFGQPPAYYDSFALSPVLFISGEKDKVASPKVAQRNFDKFYASRAGNLHRVIEGFDHMSFFQERFIPDMGILINGWLSIQDSRNFYLPESDIGN